MQVANVVGKAISTVKHPSMTGQKLLVVQPLMADGVSPDGEALIAIDTVGAGRGERVMISSDGRFTREWLKSDQSPVRWTILGICDPTTPRRGER